MGMNKIDLCFIALDGQPDSTVDSGQGILPVDRQLKMMNTFGKLRNEPPASGDNMDFQAIPALLP